MSLKTIGQGVRPRELWDLWQFDVAAAGAKHAVLVKAEGRVGMWGTDARGSDRSVALVDGSGSRLSCHGARVRGSPLSKGVSVQGRALVELWGTEVADNRSDGWHVLGAESGASIHGACVRDSREFFYCLRFN